MAWRWGALQHAYSFKVTRIRPKEQLLLLRGVMLGLLRRAEKGSHVRTPETLGQLYGLRDRHFKVSGGVPSPPEQPQLVLEWKTRRVNKKKI